MLESVVYRLLADAVMLVHFGFLAFVALGGFVAWRYRWVLIPHVAAVGWGALTVAVGLDCPLTGWEDRLRRLGDEDGLPRGFIDTYLTGVVYPQEYLRVAQLLVAALVVVSWVLAVSGAFRPVRIGRTIRRGRSDLTTVLRRRRIEPTSRRPTDRAIRAERQMPRTGRNTT